MSDYDPSMGEGLMALSETFAPIFAHGIGLKAQLVADGWSEASAEQLALTVALGLLRKSFGS